MRSDFRAAGQAGWLQPQLAGFCLIGDIGVDHDRNGCGFRAVTIPEARPCEDMHTERVFSAGLQKVGAEGVTA